MKSLGPGQPFTFGLVRGTRHGPVYVLGLYKEGETFPGTDRLSMAVQPDAERFLRVLEREPGAVVLLEGDRLTREKFLKAAGDSLRLYHLECANALLEARHAHRGDGQSEQFKKSRLTIVRRLAERYRATALLNESERDLKAAEKRILAEIRAS